MTKKFEITIEHWKVYIRDLTYRWKARNKYLAIFDLDTWKSLLASSLFYACSSDFSKDKSQIIIMKSWKNVLFPN